MSVHIAVNGFGRIGRLVARALAENPRDDLRLTVVNTRDADPQRMARLLARDSVHGPFPGKVRALDDGLDWGQGHVVALARPEPAAIEWRALGVDFVLECSGKFNTRAACFGHIEAGARKVLVSAPCDDADYTLVYGVNHEATPEDAQVISNASCTTNCLAPLAMILDEQAGIEQAMMTTIHAYTTDQRLLDNAHRDPRRARAAALSLIPASSGATQATERVLPQLAGRLAGYAVRAPTPNVSMLELTARLARPTTAEALHAAFAEAAGGRLAGVLGVCDEPLVSVDFNHDPRSCVVDTTLTRVIDGRFVRLGAWYDNEWAFAARMADTAAFLAARE